MGDTIFIFCLALIIFGPKKLPEIGRQIGKLMVEFRRASNEFKMQIEDELRASEDAERQKAINAATTMLPTPVPTAAASLLETSAAPAAETTPVIAPPTSGLPVNRTFNAAEATAGTCAYEAVMPVAETEAFAETSTEFNANLNTASNGLSAETQLDTPATRENLEPELEDSEVRPAQPVVHHG